MIHKTSSPCLNNLNIFHNAYNFFLNPAKFINTLPFPDHGDKKYSFKPPCSNLLGDMEPYKNHNGGKLC